MIKIITKLLQFKRRTLFIKSGLLMASLASAGLQAQAPPHGYERLALHSSSTYNSGVFEKKSTSFVYDHYANQLNLGTPSNNARVSDKRLIDIEVNISGGSKYDIELSGIWIENDVYFKQESWLTLGFTAADLVDWPFKRDLIPLDIERYTQGGGKEYFAVIWQRNRHKVDWEVKLEVNSDDIFRKIDEGYRVVDFDQFRAHFAQPSYVSAQYFDAVLVENSGDNFLDAQWRTVHANALDTIIYYAPNPLQEPEVVIEWPEPWLFPDFLSFPGWRSTLYGGFNVFEDEKIVDVEFVEFPESDLDIDFPDTWALVISHPVPDCRSKITEGLLQWVAGPLSDYDAERDVGRVIDYEGTAPFQNKPTVNASIYGHNSSFYGPPGFGPAPTYLHGCKHKLVVD